MGIRLSDLSDEAEWSVHYLLQEAREFGEKAAAAAELEQSIDEYRDGRMYSDPLRALARDSWDDYYSAMIWEAVEAMKPNRRVGLPQQDELLELIFDLGFLPAVYRALGRSRVNQ